MSHLFPQGPLSVLLDLAQDHGRYIYRRVLHIVQQHPDPAILRIVRDDDLVAESLFRFLHFGLVNGSAHQPLDGEYGILWRQARVVHCCPAHQYLAWP